jgi:uncharacterized protein
MGDVLRATRAKGVRSMKIDKKYMDIFEYIKSILAENDNASKYRTVPFRSRSEHSWLVFIWANRLTENEKYKEINKDALLTAALFHDVGYAVSPRDHAENGEKVFREYCAKNEIKRADEDFIAYLIKNHSNKWLMENEETPIELILLMEADMLDETGAMSIVFDCMAEGMEKEQSYRKTLEHINKKSYKTLEMEPMKTEEAKKHWKKKQELVKLFVEQYEYDLGIE